MQAKSENRYRTIFNNSAVSLWEEDISDLRKALKDLLPRSESELRAYLNEHPEFIAKAVDLIKVVNVNETTLELYEAPDKARLLGRLGSFADTSDPAVRASFAETILAIAAGGGRVLEGESTARTLRGRKLQISLKSYIPAETDRYPHMLVSVIDITAHKRAEEDLRAANRALRVRSECSKAIIQSAGESEMLERVCRVIAGPGGYHQAWAGYAEHDAKRSIRPVAQVGFKPGHLESLGLSYDDTELGRSPSGISIRTGRYATMRNIDTDPSMSQWRREEARLCGYSAALALPLIIEGKVFGVIAIRAREADAFDAAETELLCGLAEDVSFGIMTLRERESRRQAEGNVLKERELLLTLINNLPDFIYLKDRQGRYVIANKEKTRALGARSMDQVVGKTVFDFFPAEQARLYSEHEQELMRLGIPENSVEESFKNAAGETVWRMWTTVPLVDENGVSTGLIRISRDVTQRKRTEDELRTANRALRVHSECSKAIERSASEPELLEQVCRVITGTGGYRLAWVGYAQEDAGRSILPAAQVGFEPGHIESLRLSWAETEAGMGPTGQAIRTGRPAVARNIPTDPRFAGWRRTDAMKNGYSSAIALPLSAGGTAFGALGIYSAEPDAFDAAETELLGDLASDLAHGITGLRERSARLEAEQARRTAEAELRREHDLLLSIVNNLPDHVSLKDGRGRYLFANSAKLADMGLAGLEELVGRTPFDFYPAERAGKIAEHNRRIISSGKADINNEIKWRRPDGSLEWRLSSDIPLLDAQGSVTGLVAISRDISEVGRAAELLEKSLREKETLLKELQHRVKNNLGLVSSLLSLDMGNLADERSRRVFMSAQSRIRSMAAIYERLYRSADLGSVDLHLYIQDLAGAIFAAYAIDPGRVRLTTSLAEVKLDLRRAVPLGLILNELISNALKYAFPDGRPGEIRLELAKNNDEDITVSVSDDGVGLPEGFDADSSESLGMKLVKLLAGQIGGSFSAGRAAGKGASLTVKFKL